MPVKRLSHEVTSAVMRRGTKGLRFFATGRWPYFGPDLVWTKSEIPGALQALLVGIPLKLVPVPEAPFAVLNLLSTTGTGILLSAVLGALVMKYRPVEIARTWFRTLWLVRYSLLTIVLVGFSCRLNRSTHSHRSPARTPERFLSRPGLIPW